MEEVYCGVLCPLRVKDGGRLEALLTRRNFTKPDGGMMTYPGEWVFPGGTMDSGDRDRKATAIREFREELNYAGPIEEPFLMREVDHSDNGLLYRMQFFGVYGVTSRGLSIPLNSSGEVISFAWLTPLGAQRIMGAPWFTNDQLKEFNSRGLPLTERQFPQQQYLTLNYLIANQETLAPFDIKAR